MIDLSSLFIVVGVLFGLLAGDAALYGDTLRVQITVPQSLAAAGFNETAAEQIFMAEASQIVRGESMIPAPSLRVNAAPSIITALAKPLNLDTVVTAMQNQFGIDHLFVAGAVLAETSTATPPAVTTHSLTAGKPLDLALVVAQPRQATVDTVLTQADGNAVVLLRRGAAWAMEQVSPYRVALAHMISGVRGDPQGFQMAKETALRAIGKPWDPVQASERAMLRNALAIIALADNDMKAAEMQFAVIDVIPGVLPMARGVVALNRSLLAVANKDPAEAAKQFQIGKVGTSRNTVPGFNNNVDVIQGVIAWAQGDIANAERILRAIISREADCKAARFYLSKLLAAKGDAAGAAFEAKAATISHDFDEVLPGLAITLFWFDPVNGGFTRQPTS